VHVTGDDSAWDAMMRAYRQSPQGRDDDGKDMEAVRADLKLVLGFLQRVDFPGRWRREERPSIAAALDALGRALAGADVVTWDEAVLGRKLGVAALRADVLAYAKPHGIRVTGWRFLTDRDYPVETTIKTALHELLHPPFTRSGELDQRLTALERDPFFQQLLKDHDPHFGYTEAGGLTEEDCAESIDVLVSERHGLLVTGKGRALTGAEYFAGHDDGLHVLAFVLYERMRKADPATWLGFEPFLLGLLRDGTLGPGALQRTFEAAPGHYSVDTLRRVPPPR
jgi:hypothetical protein